MSQEYSANQNELLEPVIKESVKHAVNFVISSHVDNFLRATMNRNLSATKENEIGLLFAEPWRTRMNIFMDVFRMIKGDK